MNPYKARQLPFNDIKWDELISLIGAANAGLAKFDGMLQSVRNPNILLSPLINKEAVLSSKIEGTQASMEDVLVYEADPKKKLDHSKYNDIMEINNYRVSILTLEKQLKSRPLSLNLIKKAHNILLRGVRGRFKSPGQFRNKQNYIGPDGCSIEEATYIPPDPKSVLSLMQNWEEYIHYPEKDPIVQLAIIKGQFEIIHPFMDGNGRIGRMLVPIFLFSKNVISRPVFYISSYFDKNRNDYYDSLDGITKNQNEGWFNWIKFFLEAVTNQANDNITKTTEILNLYEKTKTTLANNIHTQYSIQCLDGLFTKILFSSSSFAESTKIKKHTALRLLRDMEKHNIIKVISPSSGSRATLFVFPELFNISEGKKIF